MKEINDIIFAYRTESANNIRMALATVVKVVGSSYRQPGARMLVTEDGRLTGAISGGCLEGDALRKALLAIHRQKNGLITYDTNGDDAEFGVQLGCNGIVHILFEYIDTENPDNPVALLERLQRSRQESVIVTLFSTTDKNEQRGTILVANEPKGKLKSTTDFDVSSLADDIRWAKDKKRSFLKKLQIRNVHKEALIEYVAPTVQVVIVGAGNDAMPLVEIADLLGWETIIIDGRATHATARRFPKAKQVIWAAPEQAVQQINIDDHTVFVLMTHNYNYDLAMLKYLVKTVTPYIGSLGPKTKLIRMFDDMENEGMPLNEEQKSRIYGPIGLDIGAETSEEIALSVVSEIKTILSERQGSPLKFLKTKIHEDIPIIP